MKKKVAVILSGCGRDDGSEIHESVLTLLALDRAGVQAVCFAPNQAQARVMNMYTGEVAQEQRDVLVESARIARGDIKPLEMANPDFYDAVIVPGGVGAAINLSSLGSKGPEGDVIPSVKKFIQAMAKAGKPAGFICIAPLMISKIYGPSVVHTIGNDTATIKSIQAMGGIHQNCPAHQCCVDQKHKVVSTPGYMLAGSITELAAGIDGLVEAVLKWI